jgi:hypothetical protein
MIAGCDDKAQIAELIQVHEDLTLAYTGQTAAERQTCGGRQAHSAALEASLGNTELQPAESEAFATLDL